MTTVRRLSISDKLIKLIAGPDLALDLGTANTRLYAQGRGLICDEPSVINSSHNRAPVSENGRRHPGSGSNSDEGCTRRVTPLTGGVVTDVEGAARLLMPFIRRARSYGLSKPRVLACAPTDASKSEVAALIAAISRAGASSIRVVSEPMAAAVGAGLDISLPYAQMLIDIGDGVTDIAVIRSGVLIKTAAVRSACRDIYAMVQSLMAKRYAIIPYWREAERVAKELGWSHATNGRIQQTVIGVDRASGREIEVTINEADVADAMLPVIKEIRGTLRRVVRGLAPDVAVEVIESGVCLTGGGSYLPGIKEMIAAETSLDVHVAANPLHAVINGAGQMLAVGAETGLWRS